MVYLKTKEKEAFSGAPSERAQPLRLRSPTSSCCCCCSVSKIDLSNHLIQWNFLIFLNHFLSFFFFCSLSLFFFYTIGLRVDDDDDEQGESERERHLIVCKNEMNQIGGEGRQNESEKKKRKWFGKVWVVLLRLHDLSLFSFFFSLFINLFLRWTETDYNAKKPKTRLAMDYETNNNEKKNPSIHSFSLSRPALWRQLIIVASCSIYIYIFGLIDWLIDWMTKRKSAHLSLSLSMTVLVYFSIGIILPPLIVLIMISFLSLSWLIGVSFDLIPPTMGGVGAVSMLYWTRNGPP